MRFCFATNKCIFAVAALLIVFAFCDRTSVYAQRSTPGQPDLIELTDDYRPALIKGVRVDPDNALAFQFIIDPGGTSFQDEAFQRQATKLIKYFLTALTIPEDELWVNLSPYESHRIIPDRFGQTEMGRDLLELDYQLKQLTSSMMYPETPIGQSFWQRVYQRAQSLHGSTEIPMNTYNKIWIIPESAQVYEDELGAFVVDSHLQVMLEEDYLALQHHTAESAKAADDVISGVSSKIVREVLIPEIEHEVNNGKIFAELRQMYSALVLAAWYKQSVTSGLLDKSYVDQGKVQGVHIQKEGVREEIYQRYVMAFRKGVYDYIREDVDLQTGQLIPRRYFSGGVELSAERQRVDLSTLAKELGGTEASLIRVSADLEAITNSASKIDRAQLGQHTADLLLYRELMLLRDQNLPFRPEDFRGTGTELERLPARLLEKAIDIMKNHHIGQFRADGTTEYITHPLGVAAIYLNELGINDPEVFMALLFHDVIENSITYYTDLPINKITEEEAIELRKRRPKISRSARDLHRVTKLVMDELVAAGVDRQGLDLDRVFSLVNALSKHNERDIHKHYLPGLVDQGSDGVLAKLMDQIHNIRTNIFATDASFVEKYVFGDGHKRTGSIYIYLEAPVGTTGKPFVDHLNEDHRHVKTLYQIALFKTIEGNLERLTRIHTIRDVLAVIHRIAPDLTMDLHYHSREHALEEAIAQMQQRFDQQVAAIDAAMISDFTKGGIDLNQAHLKLEVAGERRIQIQSPESWTEESVEIEGFVPVIQEVVPMIDPLETLGLGDSALKADSLAYEMSDD